MKIEISVEVSPDSAPIVTVGQLVPFQHETETAIPQITFSSAPALEVRELGSGQRISQEQMLKELSALGGEWRLETRQELYALVDLTHKNQHGAYTRDPSLHPDPYWSADKHPADPAAGVVVWFVDGSVDYYVDDFRARARAVRVSGQ